MSSVVVRSDVVAAIRQALLAFYRRQGRDLPWRRTRDPYAIWLSEVMLQQTQVETARPRYVDFLRRFPSVERLAQASTAEVCEAWAGLGYYRRAQHLHRAANTVMREYGGRLPQTMSELSRLPGVGPYTAGAVASIAFGEPVAAVDGNAVRVLARLFGIPGRAQSSALRNRVASLAHDLAQSPRPGDVNQALMDLGATVCTPLSARCGECALNKLCRAHASGKPERYPEPAKRAPAKPLAIAFAWAEGPRGVLLWQRPLSGLWAGLWELPSATGKNPKQRLERQFGLVLGPRLVRVEHQLTHRRVLATVYSARLGPGTRPPDSLRRVADPLARPLSALARKAILQVQATLEGAR